MLNNIKITENEMKFIQLLQNMTGATVVDCIVDEKTIMFTVKKGEVGLAVGKGGETKDGCANDLSRHAEEQFRFEPRQQHDHQKRHQKDSSQRQNIWQIHRGSRGTAAPYAIIVACESAVSTCSQL